MSNTDIQNKMLELSAQLRDLVMEQKALEDFSQMDFDGVTAGNFFFQEGKTILNLEKGDLTHKFTFTTNNTIGKAFQFVAQEQQSENISLQESVKTEMQNLLNLLNS